MQSRIHKTVILQNEEVSVLAVLSGIHHYAGIFRTDMKVLSKQDLYYCLHGLVKRGQVSWDEEDGKTVWTITDIEIKEMFSDIKDCSKIVMIYGRNPDNMILCCYYSREHIVISQVSNTDEDSVKFHRVPKEKFFESLKDYGLLPDDGFKRGEFIPGQDLEETLDEKNLVKFDRMIPAGICMEDKNIRCLIDKYPPDGENPETRIGVYRKGLCDYSIIWRDDRIGVDTFSERQFKKILVEDQ